MVEMSDVVYFEVYNVTQCTHKSDHVGRRQAFILIGYIFIHSDLIPAKSCYFAAKPFVIQPV